MTGCDWAGCSAERAGASAWCTEHRPTQWTAADFTPGPEARVKHYDSGEISSITWPEQTQGSRSLSCVRFSTDGVPGIVTWQRGTTTSCPDVPSRVVMHQTGWSENYSEGDLLHRLSGPASTSFSDDGAVKQELFFVSDRLHRVDGPAQTVYGPEGSVVEELFVIAGVEVTETGLVAYREAVASGAPHEWALAFALGEGVS